MSQNVSTNFTLPTVLGTLKSNAAVAKASSNSSSSSTSTDNTVQSTFLNLLVKELQNQDPTAPMDSTAMVGQMISLNQLDQLISINQVLGGTSTGTAAATTGSQIAKANTQTAGTASAQPLATSTALPFDPNTLMPLGMSGNSAATAAYLNSAVSPAAWLDNANTINSISGGK
jgi:flagellar basal-body rod modification protein FlgD